jgi:hypothetical protein
MTKRYPSSHDDDDDDDAFDRNGVLKDGRSFRVPLYMADSLTPLQRSVAADSAARGHDKIFDSMRADADRVRIVDAFGGTDGLHRPGARYPRSGVRIVTVDHARQATLASMRSQAHALRDAEATYAWRGGPQEGDHCTIDGAAGTLVREGGDLVCRPVGRQDAQSVHDAIQAAYDESDWYSANAWKGADWIKENRPAHFGKR